MDEPPPAVADLDPSAVEYCVFDLETTGVYNRDRVIEVGMVRTDSAGNVLDHYETLINPGRTATDSAHIHGISDAELLNAPAFEDVAGDISALLDGAIWGAHNASFDLRFLHSEFGRIGEDLSDWPSLCTMSLSTHLGGPSQPTLEDCCRHFGVDLEGPAHSALVDAKAAAAVLACMLRASAVRRFADLPVCQAEAWLRPLPTLSIERPAAGKRHLRGSGPENKKIAVADPDASGSGKTGVTRYREVLARTLDDRIVTEEEAEALLNISSEFGLSPSQAQELHTNHFKHLAEMALADGLISASQSRDLGRVAELLGLDRKTADELIRSAQPNLLERLPLDELAGRSVCFTGEFQATRSGRPISRREVEAAAREIGMHPQKGATKKLDILVTTDAHSMSGKTRKAREYGTRIIAADAFLTAIGFATD